MKDMTLLRRTTDGAVSTHADLSALAPYWINDMWVDAAGRAWVGTIGFAIHEGDAAKPGPIFRVDPDGSVAVAAEDLWCPNGIVTIEGGKTLVVAESRGVSSYYLDVEGGRRDAFTRPPSGQ